MAHKWFSKEDNDVLTRLDPMPGSTPTSPRKPKKSSVNGSSSSRLSATFTDSRPWTMMSSARSSDQSSSSSRKRHSFFGSRSSGSSFGTTSADPFTSPSVASVQDTNLPPTYPRPESKFSIPPPERAVEHPRPSSSGSNDSRTTVLQPDNRRSMLFPRSRSSRSLKTASIMAAEPFNRFLRGESRTSSFNRSGSAKEDESEQNFYHKWKKKSISPPFNFQHVTHTQHDHLPELESVTDRELKSEFWAASAYQAPKSELRGIRANAIQTQVDRRLMTEAFPTFHIEPDHFTFAHGPLAGMSSNLSLNNISGDSDQLDLNAVNEQLSRPSAETRSRSFTQSSTSSRERLTLSGAESRDPPTMVHPAFRGQDNVSPTDKPLPQEPVYELPAISLESVPEELEDTGLSPTKSTRRGTWLELSPPTSPMQTSSTRPNTSPPLASTAQDEDGFVFTSFPAGNAFAQAYGGDGVELPIQSNNRLSFGGENSIPSLTSGGESWENDVDFCYLVEAESTCDFDWVSLSGSRKGSTSGESRRDSTPNMSLRGTSMHEDTLTRPTSQRSSTNTVSEDGLFTGIYGFSSLDKDVSTSDRPSAVTAPTPALQHLHPSSLFARTLSSDSVSGRTLSPIIESPARTAANKGNRNSLVAMYPTKPMHTRSISDDGNNKPSAPRVKSNRWSIATPACLPEDVRQRKPDFTSNTRASVTEQTLFSAPVLPPPQKELPPLPNKQLPLTPPISPPTLSSPEFTALRRPSSPQDRALLQAAGRIVQRGRISGSRPSITPSRLSHVQSAPETSTRSAMEAPGTPTKTSPIQFELALFHTPPTPPQQQTTWF